MPINLSDMKSWLRRRVGDTGPVPHWSNEYLDFAIEEAVITVVNDIPEGFTQILDLAVNADGQTIDLPEHGVVFTRAYGEVIDGKIVKTFKWVSETGITNTDACWRDDGGSPTHAIYTDDQHRVWLNGITTNPIRCSVSVLPQPIIPDDNLIQVRSSYKNLICYSALTAMYGLTTNGVGKMEAYQKMYLQGVERKRSTALISINNNAKSERRS